MWGLTVQPKARPVSMEVFRARMFGGMSKSVSDAKQSAMENGAKKEYVDTMESVTQTGEKDASAKRDAPVMQLSKKQGILIAAAAAVILVAALLVIMIC